MWSAAADPMLIDEEEKASLVLAGNNEDTPMVEVIQKVPVITGEENEDTIHQLRARKLYRFDRGKNQWKERGCDTLLKLLRSRDSGKVRLVMRESKTLRIRANHLVKPIMMSIKEHACNTRSCVWYATDFAEEELRDEQFCITFASIADKISFMDRVREVAEPRRRQEENEDLATAVAELLDKYLRERERQTDRLIKEKYINCDTS